jgi:hypothetical protein
LTLYSTISHLLSWKQPFNNLITSIGPCTLKWAKYTNIERLELMCGTRQETVEQYIMFSG